MNLKATMLATVASCCAALFSACDSKDVAALKRGDREQRAGDFDKAKKSYETAALIGNPEGYKRIAEIAIRHDFTSLSPENVTDYIAGYDKWLVDAKGVVAAAVINIDKAEMAGMQEGLEEVRAKLDVCKSKIAETEEKVEAAKIRVGSKVKITGDVSDRLVTSTIALDNCVLNF